MESERNVTIRYEVDSFSQVIGYNGAFHVRPLPAGGVTLYADNLLGRPEVSQEILNRKRPNLRQMECTNSPPLFLAASPAALVAPSVDPYETVRRSRSESPSV